MRKLAAGTDVHQEKQRQSSLIVFAGYGCTFMLSNQEELHLTGISFIAPRNGGHQSFSGDVVFPPTT